jgi:uncharacterized protein YaaR (DUF327 family)
MDNTQLKEEHAKLEKLLKSQEDGHAAKFIHVASEGAHRDSRERIAATYQKLCDVGEQLGILHPVRMK